MPTLISGAVTGDAQSGDNVAVAVNGRTFTGLVVTDEHGRCAMKWRWTRRY
ncbi:hypothetical protein ACVZJW_05315 [Citrobacter portucalensis]